MRLGELFETDLSVRKTVWKKRGKSITRCDADAGRRAPTDLPQRKTIEVKANADAR